jgi:hypothetical protein
MKKQMKRNSLTRPALGAAMLVAATATSAALASESDGNSDLQRQIAELRAEVEKLRGQGEGNWLTEQRADEIRSLVHDVLSDADTRASLLGSGMTAGWDNGFKIGSADGNYSLRIAGRLQTRYIYNYQSDSPTDRHRSGFENRRTRMALSGHIVDPSWQYQIQGNYSSSGNGEFGLLDAFITKRFDNGMSLRFGQFRHNFLFEDSMSSARQLAVERSLINGRFAQSRTQGLQLSGDAGDNIRWYAAFTEGIRANLGDAPRGSNTAWNARTTEFAFTGRAEFLVAGNWRQFREFTSWAGEDFGLMIGGAIHWQRDEYGTDDDVTEMFRWTVDAAAKFGGANAFVAFIGNHENRDNGRSVDQFGLVVQGGFFFVPDEWEGFVRYEWGDADTTGIKDLHVITVGVNKYFAKHNIKWTTDVGYGINEVNSFWASGGAGWRADAAGDDGQIVIRSQLQLAF